MKALSEVSAEAHEEATQMVYQRIVRAVRALDWDQEPWPLALALLKVFDIGKKGVRDKNADLPDDTFFSANVEHMVATAIYWGDEALSATPYNASSYQFVALMHAAAIGNEMSSLAGSIEAVSDGEMHNETPEDLLALLGAPHVDDRTTGECGLQPYKREAHESSNGGGCRPSGS